MSNWFIGFLCAVALLYGTVHGLLMLVSPDKHRRFNLRVSDPFGRLKLRPPDRDPDHGLELEYRLAGLGVVLACLLIAWGSLDSFLGHYHRERLSAHGTTPIAFGKDWWGFAASAGCFLFGIYAFWWPLHFYRWSTKSLPSSEPLREPNQIRKGGRFLGTCFMVLGIVLFWLALKQIAHG